MQKELEKEEVIVLVRNSLIQKQKIQAWDIQSDNLTISNLELKAVRKDKDEIEMKTNSIADFENLKKLIKGIGRLNFFIGEENLVFYSELKKLNDDGSLTVSLPERWLIEERRFNERIKTNGLGQVHLKNKSLTSILTILDISESGFSVVLKKIDAKRFKKGAILENCHLEFLDLKIDLDYKIQRIQVFKHYEFADYPYEVTVIGMSFETDCENTKNKILEAIRGLREEFSSLLTESHS
ncbi:MAG: PilZ domain-containing protein [Bacteriovoracaceae bacterium]|jgi:hypothetical protein|nr:PilZ domain-containing protein [Bacteriovoracaceae bacterium]